MKKLLVILTIAPALVFGFAGRATAGVNDFHISNYDISYTLDKDSAGHSHLTTKETITAEFPSYDQNHGIERAILKDYNGHSTRLHIDTVRDTAGNRLGFTTYSSGGNEVLRIGDADRYVHGRQTYVITYDQQDVTAYFSDTNDDEFYWNTDGVQWSVPIDTLHAKLHVTPSAAAAQTGSVACYQGFYTDKQNCDFAQTSPGTYEVSATNLAAYQNVSIAVGFKPHTFAAYVATTGERLMRLWLISLGITLVLSLLLIIYIVFRYKRQTNRANERTTVVPEYVPPKDISITAAAELYPRAKGVFTAQLLDLAVRGYLKIYQTRQKSFWHSAQYQLEIVRDIQDLKAEEQEVLTDLFDSTTVGSKFDMNRIKNSTSIRLRLSDNQKKVRKNVRGTYGLRARNKQQTAWFTKLAVGLVVLSFLTLSPPLLVAALVASIMAFTLWPVTDTGLATYQYLEGLKLYIKTAETDRIRYLQSPEGAEKIGNVNVNDPAELVKLYEKVLPYAVLFGLEKDWNKQLGKYYENSNTQPYWYSGNAPFNAAVFSSGISNFATNTAYANAGSSTSGGSGGGGFSGGGGGGGGGGGW
jgi:uncharacterized membrane protein YgcG